MEKQMRMMTKLFGIAVALGALTVGANAQTPTVAFVAGGSSALFLELGEAAGTSTGASPAGVGATCVWSQKSGKTTTLTVTDTATESGQAWVAWNPSTADNTCTTIDASTRIWAYVQLDSVLGNRVYFNGGTLGFVSATPAGAATDNLIHSVDSTIVEQATLPTAIWTALSGKAMTAAGTDIRPEDAEFAVTRATATTGCGVAIDSSQYLGLGYTAGTSVISSFYTTSTFHTNTFALPSSGYTVLSVGATPIIFAVNTSNASGFGAGVYNISKASLAKFLEGQFGSTSDLTGGTAEPATVLIREPLSGTYNTVEYAVPNTVENQNSQEAGNCNGLVPKTNPLHLASSDNASGFRNRVIGTGEAVNELLLTKDALGYSFWGTANFANVGITGPAKYLTVDGFDPLYDPSGSNYATIKNTIPTTGNGFLTDVTFTDLNNGDYPVWSMLRLVTAPTGANFNFANKLAQTAQNFVNSTTQPDFLKTSQLTRVHSHFTPPGQTVAPNNGGTCGTEAGGDVAGVILAINTCTINERQ
jgi:hypothetical protein